MHFLDPDRPRLGQGGLPPFTSFPTRSVLPGLHLSPRGDHNASQIEISAFLPLASGGASRREITLSPEQFVDFWRRWLANPEGVLKDEFGWEYGTKPVPAPRLSAPVLDLDELLRDL